jgi:hypothetical protein
VTAANKQISLMQTILAGIAMLAMLVLFHTAHLDDTKTVGALGSMRLVDRAGGFAADTDDAEAQLQQQLQAQQQMQQTEQQAEEQEQLANQQAQQAEQQGLQVEQQATLSVPGN